MYVNLIIYLYPPIINFSDLVTITYHFTYFSFLLWQVYNPATGEVIANVACMGGRETNDAIASAYDAFHCMKLYYISHNFYII